MMTMKYEQIKTKEELAEYILESLYHVKYDDRNISMFSIIMEAAVEHAVFKAQDFMFYVEWLNARPIEMCNAHIDTVRMLTYAYIESGKLQPVDYDTVFKVEPITFIDSAYFTLKEFNKYYYDPDVVYSGVKDYMRKRIKEL